MKKITLILLVALLIAVGFKSDNPKTYKVDINKEQAKQMADILDNATRLISNSDIPARDADRAREGLQGLKGFVLDQIAKQDSTIKKQ